MSIYKYNIHISPTTSFLNATNLTYASRDGITAAAGTILALYYRVHISNCLMYIYNFSDCFQSTSTNIFIYLYFVTSRYYLNTRHTHIVKYMCI